MRKTMTAATKSLKILIVEDSPMVMKVHKAIFNDLGYTPDAAEDGEVALALATANEFDVIFMDIGLPKIRGTDVVKKIREHEKETLKKQAYIVALTTSANIEEVRQECTLAGMDMIEEKPIDVEVLEQLLAKL